MIRAIIIEDDEIFCKELTALLRKLRPDIVVVAHLYSVGESIAYIQKHTNIDLIFSDVQLSDGLSFFIFKQKEIKIPIIFITGYDEFIVDALKYNSLYYLLKPISQADLFKALSKYDKFRQHFIGDPIVMSNMIENFQNPLRKKIVVKKGSLYFILPLDEVVLFFIENKIIYVFDKRGYRFLSDKNLGQLELELDNKKFFRANRQVLLNIDYIKSFKSYERVKLVIELSVELSIKNFMIIISQDNKPAFIKWLGGAY